LLDVPLTRAKKDYPTRLDCFFEGKKGQLVIDQIRAHRQKKAD